MTIISLILYLVIKGLIATNALYFSVSSTVVIRLAATYMSRPLLQGNNVPSITTIHITTKLRQERERERIKERKKERKRKKERNRESEKKR